REGLVDRGDHPDPAGGTRANSALPFQLRNEPHQPAVENRLRLALLRTKRGDFGLNGCTVERVINVELRRERISSALEVSSSRDVQLIPSLQVPSPWRHQRHQRRLCPL